MTNKYFPTCETLDDLKSLYRKLAQANHPDHGGDTEIMKLINLEYASAVAEMQTKAARQYRTERNAAGHKTMADDVDLEAMEAEMRRIIELVLNLGLTAEICGSWVWVSGDTKPVKDQLKAAGLKWASKKMMWFYAGVPAAPHHKEWDMAEVRATYGSVKVSKRADDTERKPAAQLA